MTVEKYLVIITTVLVLTQIVRLIQNTIQLRRQRIMFEAQLGQLQDVTPEDFEIQRTAYGLQVEYLKKKLGYVPPINGWERNDRNENESDA